MELMQLSLEAPGSRETTDLFQVRAAVSGSATGNTVSLYSTLTTNAD